MPSCPNKPRFSVRPLLFLVALLLVLITGNALAQSYDNPGLGQKPVASHPQDYKPLGVRAGGFMLHPGVEFAAEWHDNILYTYDNPISDTIFHVRPYITAMSNWSSHSVSIRAAADIARYQDYSVRDYEDYFLQLSGQFDITSRNSFNYGADYMQLHEERNTRDAEQGIAPTTYTLLGGNLGYEHMFNRFSIGLGYSIRRLDYDDNIRLGGEIIDNQDRDRTGQDFSARFGYQFQTDKQVFVQVGFDSTDFEQDSDRNDYNRDSTGFNVGAGLSFTITGVLSGDVYASYYDRSYDDPALVGVSGWGLGGSLQWAPTMLTTVSLNLSTGIEDTTQSTASGYLRSLYSVRVDHELLRNLQIMGQVSYSTNDYQLLPGAPEGARKTDTFFGADVGATWFINRWSWLSASYKYGNFDTNVEFDDFTANSVWLVLGLER